MADLSDVTAYIAQAVAAAVYPNGTSQASIAPVPSGFTNPANVRIYEGWPLSEQLDLDLAGQMKETSDAAPAPRPNGPCPNVSIYPRTGTPAAPYQILDQTYVLEQPNFGLSVSVDGDQITITGTPNPGEFVTLVADRRNVFSEGGASAAAVLAALLADAQAVYPDAEVSGNTLTLPYDFSLTVQQGGVGLLAKVIHRQCHIVMVTVWAQDHNTRSVLAKAIDTALKAKIVVTLPDQSDLKIVYSGTFVTDEGQNATVYRRDLYYLCDYATLETFAGVTITSVTGQITVQGVPPQEAIVIASTTAPPPSSSSPSLDFSDSDNSQYVPLI